jgi:hypothetical protein
MREIAMKIANPGAAVSHISCIMSIAYAVAAVESLGRLSLLA